jgi:hypothetical protein
VLTDQAARDAQRVQLLAKAAHVGAQLFELVDPAPPAQANDLLSGQEAVGMAQEDRQQVPLLGGER